ncbi:2Fe-2S iron-sulfur cluster binding domain-containing protein [Caenimonas sedimenti]|uniref:2Fe-2S iron-sulfur cluster binding domain-containing protein n=1 Tax=Caenimonas sedimenti TaxID=2596921 RepID=A0A562ZSA7_9BURK|nr:2Fe-2S iron-sulfur cluster-binding protein [Caenimonas sedimenti]TWO71287.1 2Fe-2S iron-sulfur cluster binding domain-containing protein [Caenimonas sedimenti]
MSSAAASVTACRHLVRLRQTGESYDCTESETLLQGMVRLGRKGIPVGCVNGGCGVCKISVCVGSVRKVGAMSRAHVSAEEEARGVCLACRVSPLQCVEVEVVGKLKKALGFQWGAGASFRSGPADETNQSQGDMK